MMLMPPPARAAVWWQHRAVCCRAAPWRLPLPPGGRGRMRRRSWCRRLPAARTAPAAHHRTLISSPCRCYPIILLAYLRASCPLFVLNEKNVTDRSARHQARGETAAAQQKAGQSTHPKKTKVASCCGGKALSCFPVSSISQSPRGGGPSLLPAAQPGRAGRHGSSGAQSSCFLGGWWRRHELQPACLLLGQGATPRPVRSFRGI